MNKHKIKQLRVIIAAKEAEIEGKCCSGTLGGFLGSGNDRPKLVE
jgi:hypothetical protein